MKRYSGTGRLRLWTWVFMSMRLGFATLLALGVASAGWGNVTLNGQPLDNVHDIMAATGHGLRAFPKHSLAVVRWNDNALAGKGANNFVFDILGINGDKGTVSATASLADDIGWTQRNGGLHAAVSVGTDADGNHLTVAAVKKTGTENLQLYSFYPSRDAEGKVTLNVKSKDFYSFRATAWTEDEFVTDIAGGLFIDGREYFVLTEAGANKSLGTNQTFYYIVIPVDDSYHELSWTDALYENSSVGSHWSDMSWATYASSRVVTGDFDGDGVRDEFAVVYSYNGTKGYHLVVYKAYNEQDGGTIRFQRKILCDTTVGTRDNNGEWIDGADIAAGDFDGDGKTELAVAMNDLSKDDGFLTVQTFKWNGSTFDSTYTDMKGNNDYRLSNLKYDKNGYSHNYGLACEAADMDGDGKDEIVTLAAQSTEDEPGYLFFNVWKCGSDLKPANAYRKNLREHNIYLPSNAHANPYDYVNSWFHRDFTLAVGPFTGKLNGTRACSDVAISWAGDGTDTQNDNPKNGQHAGPESKRHRVFLFKTELNSDGSFKGFSDPITLMDEEPSGAIGLVAGDLLGETANLEEPSHMKLEAYKSYAAVLQVPPYHVDAIQAPWAAAAPSAPVNFSHLGRTVQHTNSQSGSTANDTTATTRTFSEEGWNYGADVEVGKGIAKKAVKGIGFNFSAGYSGGFRDSSSETQTEANKSSASFTMDTSLTTALTDALMYYQTDMHIWRYPVSKPVPSWLLGSLIEAKEDFNQTGEANGDVFVTYTLCDEPQTVMSESLNSSNYDDYAPSHEEGNLFSYPNSASRGMDNAQQTLGSGLNFTLNVTTAQTTKFTQSGSSTESQSSTSKHTETNGFHAKASLSGRIKALFSGSVSGNTSYADTYGTEVGDSSSFTKTWSDAEGITVSAPTGNLAFNTGYVDYTTLMQTYADAAGILNTAFGVNFSDGWLWKRNTRESQQSPYVEKPDPALVLPGRYDRKMTRDAGGSYPIWEFNLDASSATKIRGMLFYSNVTNEYVTAALEQDWPYTISFPIYNASFVDAGEVTVEFGYESNGSQTPLGRKSVTLKGWNNADMNEPNKAVVSFDWTPNLTEGDYDFYVKLDPDNALDEVHETWSHETPTGNNYGYHPFSVVNSASTVSLAADSDSGVSASDFSMVFVDLEAEEQTPMNAAEFRRYAMNHSTDFRAAGRITYNGTDTLTNVCVDVMRNMTDGTRRHVANRHIPTLRPGKTRTFSFVVDHEKMAEGTLVVDLTCGQGGFLAGVTSSSSGTSSSGGCSTGFGGLAVLAALALALRQRNR